MILHCSGERYVFLTLRLWKTTSRLGRTGTARMSTTLAMALGVSTMVLVVRHSWDFLCCWKADSPCATCSRRVLSSNSEKECLSSARSPISSLSVFRGYSHSE